MRPERQCHAPTCRRRIPAGGKRIYCSDRCRQRGHRAPRDRPRPVDSDSWQTPGYILEAVRVALGGIDLDPASSATANVAVRAARYYSRAEDGAALPWAGAVWLNPPYSADAVKRYGARLADHWRTGQPGICIVRADGIITTWGGNLLAACSRVIVPPRRVAFVAPLTGAPLPAPNFGSVLLAGGPLPHPAALARLGAVLRY